MKQGQKPFEVKETDDFKLEYSGYGANYVNEEVRDYINAANAEIRRLQGEVRRLIKTNAKIAADALEQLDDAPTWGEWVECTRENLSKASVGLYEFETNDGMTFLASWRITISSYPWLKMDGETCRDVDVELNPRFRRLNYEPQQVKNQGAAKMTNEIPRRNRIDLYTPAEHAIRAAILAVEEMGADPILTDAVGLLGDAQNKVADFVELHPAQEAPVGSEEVSQEDDGWTPINSEEQIEGLPNGAYEFLYDIGVRVLAVKGETPERKGWIMIGQIALNSASVDSWERDDDFVFGRVKSYRLIHVFEAETQEAPVESEGVSQEDNWTPLTGATGEIDSIPEGLYAILWHDYDAEQIMLVIEPGNVWVSDEELTWKSFTDDCVNQPCSYQLIRKSKPQPAREVEKDYFGNTAKEWLESEGEDEVIGLLAKDLLAVQAELRELKGKR